MPIANGAAHAPATLGDYLLATADTLLLLAVVWTVISAYEYLRGAWDLLTRAG